MTSRGLPGRARLRARTRTYPTGVRIYVRVRVPGQDIAQPGKDLVFAKLDSSNPPDIAPFSVKHAVSTMFVPV